MRLRWRPVVGFEGIYDVSDAGYVVRVVTHGRNPKPTWRLLSADIKPNGNVYVDLSLNNRSERRYVHRLVWEAFKGPIPSRKEPSHKNGIKHDNRLCNLQLLSRSDTMLHGFQNFSFSRNRVRGSAHHKAKLSEEDVITILRLSKTHLSRRRIADRYGVSATAIAHIVNRKSWKHLTG